MANMIQRIVKRIELELKSMFYSHASINGLRLKIDKNNFSKKMKMRLHRGKFELPELALIKEKINGNERILELGAGIGFISMNLVKKVGSDNLFAYEINPGLINIIKENQKLNGLDFTINSDFLTSDKTQVGNEMMFYTSKQFYSSSFVEFDDYVEAIPVKAKFIDDEIDRLRIDTLVIDVEGCEYDMFENWTLPSAIKKVCIEIHPYKVKAAFDIGKVLEMQGFEADNTYLDQHILYVERG
jgi:FkbM family methyltransferase